MSLRKLCLLEGLGAFLLGVDYGFGKVFLSIVIDKQLLRSEIVGLTVAAHHQDILINVDCCDKVLRWVFKHIFSLLLEIYYNNERALSQLGVHLIYRVEFALGVKRVLASLLDHSEDGVGIAHRAVGHFVILGQSSLVDGFRAMLRRKHAKLDQVGAWLVLKFFIRFLLILTIVFVIVDRSGQAIAFLRWAQLA